MKDKGKSKKSDKPVAQVNAQKSENKSVEKAMDSFAATDKDTTKVRAVDGNATA